MVVYIGASFPIGLKVKDGCGPMYEYLLLIQHAAINNIMCDLNLSSVV